MTKTNTTSSVGKNISSLSTSTIQKAVGAKVDNSYGPKTTEAVKAFQKANGLVADGIVGPKTQAVIQAKSTPTLLGGSSSSGNSVIKNQSNLVSSTAAERAKLNGTGVNIDNTVNNLTGTNTNVPKGWDPTTYANFKKANPTLEPDSEDTFRMLNAGNENTGNIKDATGNSFSTSLPKDMSYNLPSPSKEGNKWVYDASGKPFEMDPTGKVTSNPIAEQEYNTNVQKNKDIQTQNDMYDTLKANVSAAHQVIIDSIKQKAEEQKTAMEEINKSYLASKQVAGFRTGGTEYTPEIAMGILKNEEEEGVRRIKEIDDNMTLALAEAVSAKNDKDLQVAQQKFDNYTKLQKAKETAIIDQYKMYLDNQKYINDAKKSLETETRAKEDQAMQKLKAASDAYVKGYESSKDKNAYVQSIATNLGLPTDIVLGQILNAQPKPKTTSNSTSPKTINYSAATIPSTLKDSILDDIKKDPTLTLQELYDAYPEVQSTYLKSVFDSLKPKKKTSDRAS